MIFKPCALQHIVAVEWLENRVDGPVYTPYPLLNKHMVYIYTMNDLLKLIICSIL